MVGLKPREIAIKFLTKVSDKNFFIKLDSTVANVNELDKKLIHEIVYGTIRWKRTIDWIIARLSKSLPANKFLKSILRSSVYQLIWLDRVPAYAVVNCAVSIAKSHGFSKQSGYINGFLRNCVRQIDVLKAEILNLQKTQPDIGFSHPTWLFNKWSEQWGTESARKLLQWNNTPAEIYARACLLKTKLQDLLNCWEKEHVRYIKQDFFWTQQFNIFLIKVSGAINELESFKNGMFYVQDPSTVLPVYLLNPRSGEKILDYCSAPGGKTTLIAELLKNKATIIASDVDHARLASVQENCNRLGISCVFIADLDSIDKFKPFDSILLDVPCSNTGVMRRRIELRWRITRAEIEKLTQKQFSILQKASTLIKPGGKLVYSTCSIEPEENSNLIRHFLSTNRQYTLIKEHQLLPFRDGVDGAYAALLRKN